jgi:hypothetical protein
VRGRLALPVVVVFVFVVIAVLAIFAERWIK